MPERVALYLQDAHDLRAGLDYVRYAERFGFEAVWQAESRLVRDAIFPMAAYAAVTERLKVGSGVINNWTRNIGLLAATFLTLDDLAPNRIICGIGAWWDPLTRNVGVDRRKPLTAMRETLTILRRLLNMERVIIGGGMAGAWLHFIDKLMGEVSNRAFKIPTSRCKVLPGTLGDDAGILGAARLVFQGRKA